MTTRLTDAERALLVFVTQHPGAVRGEILAAGHHDVTLERLIYEARLISRSWAGMFWRFYPSWKARVALAESTPIDTADGGQ